MWQLPWKEEIKEEIPWKNYLFRRRKNKETYLEFLYLEEIKKNYLGKIIKVLNINMKNIEVKY